jgi:hypothetical protein
VGLAVKIVTEYDDAYVRCTFFHNRQVRPAFEWVRSRYIRPRHRAGDWKIRVPGQVYFSKMYQAWYRRNAHNEPQILS